MPENAAEKLASALERMRDRSLSETEHEVAVEEFVVAHKEMLDRLGVERRGPAVMVGLVLSGLLVLLLIVSMAINISASVTASGTADTANETANAVRELQRDTILSNRETCERTNDARVASVQEKRNDIKYTLRPQLALWEAAVKATPIDPATPKPVVDAFSNFLDSLRLGIESKQRGIRESIASQSGVAIEPGSPIADCDKINPLDPPSP